MEHYDVIIIGTGSGVVRGLLDAAGVAPRKATMMHGAAYGPLGSSRASS